MDFQDIQIFSRVAAVQNLSAVGNELGLTPGTISKRVQALEDELGVRLFERTTRSIRITEEGSRFLTHVQAILVEIEKAKATVADTTAQPKGRLRIVAAQSLAQMYISPALVTFARKYPDVDVHVDFTDGSVHLQDEGYDIAVIVGTPQDSPLMSKRLFVDRQILVASPAFVSGHPAPRQPEDLAALPCLTLGDNWTWSLFANGETRSVKVVPRVRSDSAEMLRLAAVEGLGIAQLSELHVAADLAAGRLERVLPGYELSRNSGVWVLYPSGKHVLPRLRVFIDHLAAVFKELRAPAGAGRAGSRHGETAGAGVTRQ